MSSSVKRAVGLAAAVVVASGAVLAQATDGASDPATALSAAKHGLNVPIKLDRSRVAKATIGPRGGTLRVSTRNKTRFTLRIPAGALAVKTKITMTAVRSFGGWRSLVGAVQLQPFGLTIPRGATLSITPAKKVPVAMQIPLAASSNGRTARDVHLYPPDPRRAQLVLSITHFSAEAEVAGRIQTVDTGHIELLPADKGHQITLLEPVKPTAQIEETAAKLTLDVRNRSLAGEHISIDDPAVMDRYARAFMPEYERVGTLILHSLGDDSGWESTMQAALALDNDLKLLTGHSFEWAPPPTTDKQLAATLREAQQFIKDNLGKVLQNAYDSAKARCKRDRGWTTQMKEASYMGYEIGAPLVQVISSAQLEADVRGCARKTGTPRAFQGTLTYSLVQHDVTSSPDKCLTSDGMSFFSCPSSTQFDNTSKGVAQVTFKLGHVSSTGTAYYDTNIIGTIQATETGNQTDVDAYGSHTCTWNVTKTLIPQVRPGSFLVYRVGASGPATYELALDPRPRTGENLSFTQKCASRGPSDGHGYPNTDYTIEQTLNLLDWGPHKGVETKPGILSYANTDTSLRKDCPPVPDSANEVTCSSETTSRTWNLRAVY